MRTIDHLGSAESLSFADHFVEPSRAGPHGETSIGPPNANGAEAGRGHGQPLGARQVQAVHTQGGGLTATGEAMPGLSWHDLTANAGEPFVPACATHRFPLNIDRDDLTPEARARLDRDLRSATSGRHLPDHALAADDDRQRLSGGVMDRFLQERAAARDAVNALHLDPAAKRAIVQQVIHDDIPAAWIPSMGRAYSRVGEDVARLGTPLSGRDFQETIQAIREAVNDAFEEAGLAGNADTQHRFQKTFWRFVLAPGASAQAQAIVDQLKPARSPLRTIGEAATWYQGQRRPLPAAQPSPHRLQRCYRTPGQSPQLVQQAAPRVPRAVPRARQAPPTAQPAAATTQQATSRTQQPTLRTQQPNSRTQQPTSRTQQPTSGTQQPAPRRPPSTPTAQQSPPTVPRFPQAVQHSSLPSHPAPTEMRPFAGAPLRAATDYSIMIRSLAEVLDEKTGWLASRLPIDSQNDVPDETIAMLRNLGIPMPAPPRLGERNRKTPISEPALAEIREHFEEHLRIKSAGPLESGVLAECIQDVRNNTYAIRGSRLRRDDETVAREMRAFCTSRNTGLNQNLLKNLSMLAYRGGFNCLYATCLNHARPDLALFAEEPVTGEAEQSHHLYRNEHGEVILESEQSVKVHKLKVGTEGGSSESVDLDPDSSHIRLAIRFTLDAATGRPALEDLNVGYAFIPLDEAPESSGTEDETISGPEGMSDSEDSEDSGTLLLDRLRRLRE